MGLVHLNNQIRSNIFKAKQYCDKKRAVILLMALFLCQSCYHQPTNRGHFLRVEQWIGRHIEQLLVVWGQPNKSYPLPNGGQIVIYQKFGPETEMDMLFRQQPVEKNLYTHYTYPPSPRLKPICTIHFALDVYHIIRSVTSEGQGCISYVDIP